MSNELNKKKLENVGNGHDEETENKRNLYKTFASTIRYISTTIFSDQFVSVHDYKIVIKEKN